MNMKTLIVEDMALVAGVLRTALERWGHEVSWAKTGQAAMALLQKDMFDLILLDIFLPDTVAYDLIPQMKSTWSGMEIITMTGHNTKDLEKKIRSQGILYYMVKPIDMKEFKSIISHLDHKRETQCRKSSIQDG